MGKAESARTRRPEAAKVDSTGHTIGPMPYMSRYLPSSKGYSERLVHAESDSNVQPQGPD
jgi:hypothetical protein